MTEIVINRKIWRLDIRSNNARTLALLFPPFSIRFIQRTSFLLIPTLVKIVVAAIEPRTSWSDGNLADHSTASVQLWFVISFHGQDPPPKSQTGDFR